jgi:hypothetical protein
MGLKQGAIGNTHGEHIGNLLEQRENEKNLPTVWEGEEVPVFHVRLQSLFV